MSVVLVEDDAPTRAHLARAIDGHPRLSLVGSAGSCDEARGMIHREVPEVLVTDLGLPDGNGNALIREFTRAHPRSLAMVITVFGDEQSLVAAIEAGATGYLLKGTPFEEVADAVLDLVAGGSPISASIAAHLLQRFRKGVPKGDPKRQESAPATSPADELTERELEVLRLVAKGFQFGEVADLLGISPHTVATHVRHVYRKLDVHSRGAAVHEAMSRGIVKL